MRGALDFETWEWENPLCCSLVWGTKVRPDGERSGETYLTDNAPFRRPEALANAALVMLRTLAVNEGVREWWAHNMGRFDGLILVDAAERVGWKVSSVIAGGRPITFTLTPPDCKPITLKDTFALVPFGLETAAREFQLSAAKHFQKGDYKVDPRLWDATHRRVGCLTDARLVLELVEKMAALFGEWGVDRLRSTFSANALACIRADLEKRGMSLPSHEGDFEFLDFGRGGYLGGRVEIFHHAPKALLCEHDISSSYPASMCNVLPWELKGETTSPRALKRMLYGDGEEGLIFASVRVPKSMHIPPLPFRPDTGGVFFPTGSWEAVFAACELRYAAQLGCEVQPHTGVSYTAETPFRDFVHRTYALKQSAKREGKLAVAGTAKLILNGGYGKFGMGPELETLHITSTVGEAISAVQRARPGTVRMLTRGASRFLSRTRTQWPKQTHYGIASYITAYSRIAVHRALSAAREVAYCDTDSVHAVALGEETKVGPGLGEWELKLERFSGRYYAPKLYRLQDATGALHFKAKGFPLPREVEEEELAEWVAEEKETRSRAARFEAVVSGRDVPLEQMASLKSQLGRYGGRFTRQGGKRAAAILRHWLGHSTKRRPLPDGPTVPWTVDEIREGEHRTAVSPLFERGGEQWKPAV